MHALAKVIGGLAARASCSFRQTESKRLPFSRESGRPLLRIMLNHLTSSELKFIIHFLSLKRNPAEIIQNFLDHVQGNFPTAKAFIYLVCAGFCDIGSELCNLIPISQKP
jgi:hypothetical protein